MVSTGWAFFGLGLFRFLPADTTLFNPGKGLLPKSYCISRHLLTASETFSFVYLSGVYSDCGIRKKLENNRKLDIFVMPKSFQSPDPVSGYITSHSIRLHPIQEKLMERTIEHVHSRMMGAPEVLQLNQNLIRTLQAKKVLDVGVFTGMSALAAALALPEGGKVVACDVSDEYISIGKPFWKEAGVESKIDVRIQPALQTLDELILNGEEGTFDFAFIDADKVNYMNYYDRCLRLLRQGGIIAIDNVLWSLRVLDPKDQDLATIALRELNSFIAKDDRVNVSMLNIGDGLTLVFKK